jgi:hypothetical protein
MQIGRYGEHAMAPVLAPALAPPVNDKIDPACKAIKQGRIPHPHKMRVRSFREALYDSGGENYFRPWQKTPTHRKLEIPART